MSRNMSDWTGFFGCDKGVMMCDCGGGVGCCVLIAILVAVVEVVECALVEDIRLEEDRTHRRKGSEQLR
jgi:hypothetical protein